MEYRMGRRRGSTVVALVALVQREMLVFWPEIVKAASAKRGAVSSQAAMMEWPMERSLIQIVVAPVSPVLLERSVAVG